VFSPRELVGERLGQKATTTVTADLEEAVPVGDDFEIAELAIHAGSELVGQRLEESGIRERTGANVIGAWIDGEFRVPPFDVPLDEHTVLLVAGEESQCEALNDLTLSPTRRHGAGTALVAGHGVTGRAAVEVLAQAGVSYTVLDLVEDGSVDVVGDATDPDDLRAAGIDRARSLILTLEDDADTIFATLVARELAPDVEIIARANDRESVRKIYRAGADYVLALSRVTGRLLGATVMDEDILSFDTQVKVVRASGSHLAGRTLAGADVRQRTGCTVIAVERNGTRITGPDPDFRLQADDDVIVAGTDDGIARFRDLA
jgi:Trk K+ transport system NAD-binding subunit